MAMLQLLSSSIPRRSSRLAAVGLIAVIGLLTLAMGPAAASTRAQSWTRQATAAPSGWLHTTGSRIVDDLGRDFRIKAANWFGMETSTCAPHGLWQINLDAGMAQISSFGFNTVRLPFANACVAAGSTANGINANLNPTLQNRTGLQVMDAVIASATSHGIKVILDRHRPDTGSQSELWYTGGVSEAQWISDWKMLATRYAADATVIGADLHNEPHGSACWGCGDPARDWAAAATRGGNAVLAANPNLLILVEGVEKQATGSSTWWGGGLADVAAHPITLTVAGRLVYSPHDYPATIYAQQWFGDPAYPANLPGLWDKNWGYLQRTGAAPVLLGEFGTTLETASDQQWLRALVGYLNANAMGFAYWSFNPNSGDTGGLVKDDWVTPQTAKLAALAPLLAGASGPVTTTTSTTAPPTTSTATTTAPSSSTATTSTATTSPSPSGRAVTAIWTLQSSWNAGYVAQFAVRPTAAAVSGWTISWPDPGATGIVNSWGMTCAIGVGRISCTGADWARSLAVGYTVQVGLQVANRGLAPTKPVVTTS